ncbi:hypothetical protein [Mycobacterium sp. UM_CSW]|uniref:hypothetical protein n=1 Tax=Mycobacterium sp. UM_CSW TaxID=1370119 RepID=UPI00040D2B1E|nr:hypothetical protein [Mycobacterium sp. UM_CSW]
MAEEMDWQEMPDGGVEACTETFRYTINRSGNSWIAAAWSRQDGTTEVKVAQYAAPTLEHAKRVPQMWAFEQQLHRANAKTVRVYFSGWVEYDVTNPQGVVDAVGFGAAIPGSAEQKVPGALTRHTIDALEPETFAIEGANPLPTLTVEATLRPPQ